MNPIVSTFPAKMEPAVGCIAKKAAVSNFYKKYRLGLLANAFGKDLQKWSVKVACAYIYKLRV